MIITIAIITVRITIILSIIMAAMISNNKKRTKFQPSTKRTW